MPTLHLRLPATSANLGPGFDALGLALDLWLEIQAVPAAAFHIDAIGRNAAQVRTLEHNLILDTYRLLAPHAPALHLTIDNQIPLGMGCGSSAAALLAGVLLANHFGQLRWTDQQILDEACRREGHPDNVAACFFGGLTASTMLDGVVTAASLGHALAWTLLLALPEQSLATSAARALLPATYSRADAVQNVQSTALLVAAFALDRPELLPVATLDRLHQPYRAAVCPLLEKFLPMTGNAARSAGIYSVTLSGAGPAVLAIARSGADIAALRTLFLAAAEGIPFELIQTKIAGSTTVAIR